MEVQIRHSAGKASEAFARGHRVGCDQPFDLGGEDTGMTPPELMLAALGACAMHYAVEFLRARKLSLDNIDIRVRGEKGGRPTRLTEIEITVDVPGLTGHLREGLLRAVDACLLHRTLCDPPKVKVAMATSLAEFYEPVPV